MKKVTRSPILKAVAFILCLVCVGLATMTGGKTLEWFLDQQRNGQDGEVGVYTFEADFNESYILNNPFSSASGILDRMLRGGEKSDRDMRQLKDNFAGDYYAKLGGTVIKNADLTQEEVENSAYYVVIRPDEVYTNVQLWYNGVLERWNPDYNYAFDNAAHNQTVENARDILQPGDCIMLRLTEQQASPLYQRWQEGKQTFEGALWRVLILFAVALISFLYLLFVTGRKPEDEEVHLVLIDRLFVELNLALIAGIVGLSIALSFVAIEELSYGNGSGVAVIFQLLTLLLVCSFAMVMELILSLVRNLKNRSFVARSFILRACKWCWKVVKKLWFWFIRMCKKAWHALGYGKDTLWNGLSKNYKTRNVALIFFGYTAVLAILAMIFGFSMDYGEGALAFVLGVVWFGVAAVFLVNRVAGFDKIVEGLKRLRAGELSYKVTDAPAGVFASMAEDINSVGDGLQAALQNEIKAERMKSELITNVSHDLKTPLTSIINYSDLLCKEHLSPEEANDYAKIIYQKSNRLKNLTSDLFDISKVQSGAETIASEKLDVCTLVRQALAEQEHAIADGALVMKVTMPECEVPVLADGKKLSRVLENLLGNCVKYAMHGTRVFITVAQRERDALIEIKNMANYAMEFDSEEITERFVRGDAARTTEGSGLGLAIAKSYVTACGGSLKVDVDGDLFKVTITFPLYGIEPIGNL